MRQLNLFFKENGYTTMLLQEVTYGCPNQTKILFDKNYSQCFFCGKTVRKNESHTDLFMIQHFHENPQNNIKYYCSSCGFLLDLYYSIRHSRRRPTSQATEQQVITLFKETPQNCNICSENKDEHVHFNDKTFCLSCFLEYIGFICSICGEPHKRNISYYLEGCGQICRVCQVEILRSCYYCGNTQNKDSMTYYETQERWYCSDCIENNSNPCVLCNTPFIRNPYTVNRRTYCRHCYNMVVPVAEYDFKMPPIFYRVNKEKPLYLGLELEIDNQSDVSRETLATTINSIANTNNTRDFVYCKHDGTCDLEIVTQPMTLNYWKRVFNGKLKRLLTYLTEHRCTSHDARSSGIHVHSSLNMYTTDQIYLVHLFFKNYHQFIKLLAQRNGDRLNQWAAICNYSNEDIFEMAKSKYTGGSKYVALRITEHDTLEYRVFRGSTRVDRVLKNLEFVHSIYFWTKSLREEECNLKSYETFIYKRRQTYNHLTRFITFLKKQEAFRATNHSLNYNRRVWSNSKPIIYGGMGNLVINSGPIRMQSSVNYTNSYMINPFQRPA